MLLGFRANGSLVDSVDLGICSGYHVAAFSVVFIAFLLGASLQQCTPAQKQAPPPKFSSRVERKFLVLLSVECYTLGTITNNRDSPPPQYASTEGGLYYFAFSGSAHDGEILVILPAECYTLSTKTEQGILETP